MLGQIVLYFQFDQDFIDAHFIETGRIVDEEYELEIRPERLTAEERRTYLEIFKGEEIEYRLLIINWERNQADGKIYPVRQIATFGAQPTMQQGLEAIARHLHFQEIIRLLNKYPPKPDLPAA